MSEVNPTPTDNRLDSNGLLYLFHRMKEIFTGMFQGKEAGKGLSTNDYTTAEKEKLAGIDMSTKADKTDTVLNTTLSRGRKSGSTVGANSIAFGLNATASGEQSTALGSNASASGKNSFAGGSYSNADGFASFALGASCNANGAQSHAEGNTTTANGYASHAEGRETIANSQYSHASGCYNVVGAVYNNWISGNSYGIGDKVVQNGYGYKCIEANSDSSFDASKWERIPSDGNVAFVVGNGVSLSSRSNALTLEWDGNLRLAKDVYVNSTPGGAAGSKLATEDSPAFTGTPTAPTASTNDNSTKIASTAFVKNAIAAALDGRVELDFQFLEELPQTGVKGIFYFIPKEDPETGDVWDEYVWNGDDEVFELIGSAKVDLTGYYNTTNLPAITNAEIDTILAT